MGARVATSRPLVAALLGVQVALAAIGVAVWRWGPDSAPPVPPFPTDQLAAGAGGPWTLESGYAVAMERALAWREGARLLSASAQIDWPWDPPAPGPARTVPGTGWLTYVFVAPWKPRGGREEAASLAVVVERLTGAVVVQDSLGWEEAPALASPTASPAVGSTEAVLAAESAWGTDFRRACPVQRHLTRVSLVTGTALPPHWLVTYQHERPNEAPETHALTVRVDAATGTVLDVGGEAPPCEGVG